ncbi:uncharacterized protein N7496_000132 [Penicillium cataractarum]|uniref:Uncharacterized protein n=1 Tax=Penicillium cataractarum TaxID=2100454 RepID=A0A9W9VTR0_9EURO|nr:uncharacterized protein N7496_000132 [Penicillium cataractarum]KAJ5389064.1 hypothetical protein N7496_000132 [Penicillium cataractarum]
MVSNASPGPNTRPLGSAIEVTAVGDPDENGVLIFLSPDMQASLKSTMDSSCTNAVDTSCYQAVMNVLEGANRVLQSRDLKKHELERREVPVLGAIAILVAGLVWPIIYHGDHVVPVPINIPPAQIEESFDLETATAIIVVTDDNASPMTVTQPPEQAVATGSPLIITTMASSGNGASVGDVAIKLDSAEAAHLQALLSGSNNGNCDVGNDFFTPTLRARQLDQSNIICAGMNVIADGITRDGVQPWLFVIPVVSVKISKILILITILSVAT